MTNHLKILWSDARKVKSMDIDIEKDKDDKGEDQNPKFRHGCARFLLRLRLRRVKFLKCGRREREETWQLDDLWPLDVFSISFDLING